MKKILSLVFLVAMLLNLWGCASASEPQVTQTVVTTEIVTEENQVTQPLPSETTQTEATVLEGTLYLKVASITFSLVGETEDVYMGLIPEELVSWESEDPSIVSVENGVLTANGVGTTTIHGTYNDQTVSCTAGCLAQTQEELESLDFEILSQPKRVPPEVDMETPCTFFDNMALVGDSISYMMLQCESKGNYLGDLLFLTRGGTSLNGFVMHSKNVYYQGAERNLEDAIEKSGVERMYILIGSNDIAVPAQRENFMKNWDILVSRIREKSPEVEIVIISNIPRYASKTECQKGEFLAYNGYIQQYNEEMQTFCQEKDCRYFDLYYYISDHCGRMPQAYNLDGYHLNDTGYNIWMQIMRYYAQYELEGGTLS